MMRALLTILLTVVFAVPALGIDFTPAELKERLDVARGNLAGYHAEKLRLQKLEYGGPVMANDLQRLADAIAAEIREIDEINKLLGQIMRHRSQGKPKISIVATEETKSGPPVNHPLEAGDVLVLQGRVEIPGTKGEQSLSHITWKLLDRNGIEIDDYTDVTSVEARGVTAKLQIEYLLNTLESGTYTVVLSHAPANDPAWVSRAEFKFKLSAPIYVTSAWVAARKNGSKVAQLKPGQKPYFHILFEAEPHIETIHYVLRAKDAATGEDFSLHADEYTVKKDKPEQRLGMMVEEYALKGKKGVIFEATLTPKNGKPVVVERRIAFAKQDYKLKVRATPTIMSGRKGKFSIIVPKDFVGPYTVGFKSAGLTMARTGDLKGTFTGTSQGSDVSRVVGVTVTDSEGRVAQGAGKVVVKAVSGAVIASQNQPRVYSSSPVPTQQASSSQSSSGEYADLGRQRVMSLRSSIGMGVGPSCAATLTAPYQNFILATLQNASMDEEIMVEVGRLSASEWSRWTENNVWIPLGRALMQAVAASPKNECYQGLARNWVGRYGVTQADVDRAIAANNGGGAGLKPSAQFTTPAWARSMATQNAVSKPSSQGNERPPAADRKAIVAMACDCYQKGFVFGKKNPSKYVDLSADPAYGQCDSIEIYGRSGVFSTFYTRGRKAGREFGSSSQCPYGSYDDLPLTPLGIINNAWRKATGN